MDVDEDALTANLIAGPSNGTMSFNSDGSFAYTPDLEFTGEDMFTYTVHGGTGDPSSATVTSPEIWEPVTV